MDEVLVCSLVGVSADRLGERAGRWVGIWCVGG